ncbi:MAG TPA: hypothetical protein VFZ11_00985 [Gemmatimonadaceae bacterium]
MSAAGLEAALRSLGVDGRVEARGALAVLVPRGGADALAGALADAALRRGAAVLAREHGFTHLALELLDEPEASRDDAPDDGADLHRD